MSKRRPNLPRRPRELWSTPEAAIQVVVPYLGIDGNRFAEPCAGELAIVETLVEAGFVCMHAGDIRSGQNALDWSETSSVDFVLTNPPWDKPRREMHRIMDHLIGLGKPVWLLLPGDWLYTQYAASRLQHCTHILAIGRVRWLEGTQNDGMDNAAWFRFRLGHDGATIIIPQPTKRKRHP